MDLEKNKQRLEIIAAQVEELKRNGGGGGTPTESDDFTPDNITIQDGGTFPSSSTERLTKHLPLEINDTLYYFLEETSVDYLYGSLPTSGAYPSISYFRIMKQNFAVEFHDTEIDTTPTEDSTNLITSGAVYDAVQGGGNYISKDFPIVGGTIGDQITVNNNSIAIGSEASIYTGTLNYSTALGNNGFSNSNSSADTSILIGASKIGYGNLIRNYSNNSILIGIANSLNANVSSVVIATNATQNSILNKQLFYSTVLGSYPQLDSLFINNAQMAFIVGTGSNGTKMNTVEIKGENALRIDRAHLSLYNGADISFTSDSEFKVGSDTNSYDLRYFAPTDETLIDGGTISATALANALKHVPLSFNEHMCYYSYEDNDNVYYVSTRLNITSLHTNVIAINKTTGVADFNEFDQS